MARADRPASRRERMFAVVSEGICFMMMAVRKEMEFACVCTRDELIQS